MLARALRNPARRAAGRRSTAVTVSPNAFGGLHKQAERAMWAGSTKSALSGEGGLYVTKYKIVRPGKEGVDWDDFMLTLPERDMLASTNKEVPLFIKYLKIVTDAEGRGDDFKDFLARAKDGLQVENDVYLTTNELLSSMWKNGYSEKERTALQFTFPSDYQFHYPELAVLFDISEEDAYKYCMRTRIDESHIGQLKTDSAPGKFMIRDHWVVFGVGAMILKTFPFFSYYFILKGFGTAMWGWTMWLLSNRWFYKTVCRNDYMAQQKTAQEVMAGEDKIMEAMQRFGNDSRCLDSLKQLKPAVEGDMAAYRKALLENEKAELIAKAQKQLQAIATYEDNINASLQNSIVREVAEDFKGKFPADAGMQGAALTSAIASLKGDAGAADPVSKFFMDSLAGIDLSGKAAAKADGTVSEKLAFAQQQSEAEFKKTFYVTADEAASVKAAGKDEGKLSELMKQIYGKVGFHLPKLLFSAEKDLAAVGDDTADAYVKEVNEARAKLEAEMSKANLAAFQASMA